MKVRRTNHAILLDWSEGGVRAKGSLLSEAIRNLQVSISAAFVADPTQFRDVVVYRDGRTDP